MDMNDFVSHESRKMEVYRLLAECYHVPGQELPATLDRLGNILKNVFPKAAEYIPAMMEEIHRGENPDCLEIEYARLFVGPYGLRAPPYGSVYLENGRQVMGASTLRAREIYVETGLDVAETFKDAPDHIAAELEFVYFLIFKAIEAIGHSDMEAAMFYLAKRRAFLQDHLGAWISEFAREVEENSETCFYRNLARATRIFIQKDLEEIFELPVPCEEKKAEGHPIEKVPESFAASQN